jgi:hypothetical protein
MSARHFSAVEPSASPGLLSRMQASMKTRRAALALAAALFGLPAQAAPGGASHHGHAVRAGVHSLDVWADGTSRLHLLLGEYRGGKPVLLHLRSDDGGAHWSQPTRVDEGLPPAHSPQRGMDAQIAATGDDLVAVWMSPGTDAWGGGPMATALSSDGGRTWRRGPNPADDGSTEGHGFIDIAGFRAGEKAVFHAVWLDSRQGKRGLRHAQSENAGATWGANGTIAPETCECCANSLLITGSPSSVAVLFRGKAPRDMFFARTAGERGWEPPVPVGDFGWKFDGCPHVGGALASTGPADRLALHAAVWTGEAAQAGVHHVTSLDQGRTWRIAGRIGTATASHPDIASRGSELALAWDSQEEGKSAIEAAVWTEQEKSWGAPRRLSAPGVAATHPRIVAVDGGFRVFWTQQQEGMPATWESALLPSERSTSTPLP